MIGAARSYYAASAAMLADQPALTGEHTADVVVVGGGFTGLSAALCAAEAGFSVVLLEAERIGWGASGRNGGQMIPGMRWSAVDLVRRFGAARARALVSLAHRAVASVQARMTKHAIACDDTPGHLQAAAKPAHYDDLIRERDCLATLVGYGSLTAVPRARLSEYLASKAYYGGLYDANGGHMHPLAYARGLARGCLTAGVRIFEASRVTAIDHGAHAHALVIAETPAGRVRARFGVLACDAFIGALAPKLGAMTMPVANYNIATAPLGAARAAALIPSNAAIADTRFVLNYFRLSADHRLIFGGGEKYTPRAPADIAGFVRPYMEGIFPQLEGVGIDYAWGGLVGVTRNRLPDFGRIGNSFYAHGWSGHGVLLTTLAGELIVEAMQGTAERFDLFANLPGKPFPGGALLRHPLYVLGMLWYALRDRL